MLSFCKQKANKMPQNCCVPKCTKKVYREEDLKISFHKFPKKKDLLAAWIQAIRRDIGRKFTITSHTRVCSRHFKESDFKKTLAGRRVLCPAAVPSIFPWRKSSPKKRKPPKPRYVVSKAVSTTKVANEELELTSSSLNVDNNGFEVLEVDGNYQEYRTSEEENMSEMERQIDKENKEEDRTTQVESVSELKKQIEELNDKLQEQKEKTNALVIELNEVKQKLVNLTTRYNDLEKKSFSLNQFRNSKSLGFYTGFANGEIFDALYNFCDPGENGENIRYWHSSSTDQDRTVLSESDEDLESFPKAGRPRLLHPKEELFITLCRLRQGFAEEHLAHLYGISQATISRIIITWVNLLYLRLKDVPMWPSREKINKHMPEQFKEKYSSTRIIIDCTEVKCQMPCSLRLNSELFSTYKNHTTLKALVGITPGGALSFVSQLYTGHISDREIVLRSGILDQKFDCGDSVMADKGFTVQDLLPLGVGLNIPPFLGSQGQMSPEDVVKTQSIASLRVHVERAINKIKNFRIWEGIVPLNLFGVVNQMWTVCAVLCNLQKPIISV